MVKRDLVRVISPGVTLEEADLDARTNNYLSAVLPGANGGGPEGPGYGFAVTDLSTGEFRIGQVGPLDDLVDEMARIGPSEILLPEAWAASRDARRLVETANPVLTNHLDDGFFDEGDSRAALDRQFPGQLPETTAALDLAIGAGGAVLEYLHQTQMTEALHLRTLSIHRTETHMVLDDSTVRNLELFRSIADGGRTGTLLWHLDRTTTPMGARTLRKWLQYPLVSVDAVRARHEGVAELAERTDVRDALTDALKGVMDLERLIGRLSLAHGNARDLVSLRASLERVPRLVEALKDSEAPILRRIADGIDPLDDVRELIARAIVDEPPLTVREGKIIRDGFDVELDEFIAISRDGKSWIAQMEASERAATGIGSLRVRYNKVFGYYIEVTKANLHNVPAHYDRKQTLVNAERFITPELKEYETKVLTAEERRVELEYDLFTRVRLEVAGHGVRVQELAARIASIDVLCSLAEVAVEYRYSRPVVDDSDQLRIRDGRHPVVERLLVGEPFVPNDTEMDASERQLLILTGPNMAGKSTYIRQVALIALMAQVGSFVPAGETRLGLVDRIFTRVGASDNLARGQSTFMVEMTETANIVRHATPRSLIILDEIGRGTSTYDGVSIAWAVAEYIHDAEGLGARTLFATHYHELTDLALTKPRVRNLTVAVKEWDDQIIFLRRIIEGGSSRSYGIQVARLAGLPQAIIDRAKEILSNLEQGELDELGRPRFARPEGENPERAGPASSSSSPKRHPTRCASELDKRWTSDTLSPHRGAQPFAQAGRARS